MVLLALPATSGSAATPGLMATTAGATGAATPAVPESGLTQEEIRDLVARLDDAGVRQLLIERLDADNARAAAEVDVTARIQRLEAAGGRLHESGKALIAAVPALPSVPAFMLSGMRGEREPAFLFWLALGFAAMLLVGWLVERGFRRIAGDAWTRIAEAEPATALGKCGVLLMRLGLELVALALFVGGALALFFILQQGDQRTRVTVMAYLGAVVAVRLYALASRFLLAPSAPALRMVAMDDATARYLHRQNIIIASIAAFGFLSCALLRFYGIATPLHHLLVILVGAWMTGTVAYTIWHARAGISGDLLGDAATAGRVRQVFAALWPKVMPAVVVVLYIVVVVVALAGGKLSYMTVFGSFFALLVVPHIDAGMERAARRWLADPEARGQLRVVALRAGRILLLFATALFLLGIWEIDLFALAQRSVGTRIAEALVDIGLTALVAYVLWEVVRINIDRKMAEEGGDPAEDMERGDEGGTGGTRLATLLPLMRLAIQVTIVSIAIMLILSALGVNIGPLLAGAGVVGIAVGFGAQTLVRDVVSGVFFLIDDAFRVGEYIDVGSVKGTVEKISVRSLRLRHHLGPLHTIPFGEIQHLTNYSRDWMIMKLEFRVTYDTDVKLVKKLFKQIGQDLLKDPELGPGFIEPFKSQGVKSMEDSAMIVRGKFMAVPGRQFVIRKEVYNRVQQAFNEHGIQFAHRRVSVELPPGVDPTSPEGKAMSDAAAASVAAQDEEEAAAGGKAPSAA